MSEPARTKLLLKFWAAMHLAGFDKSQEWEAQERLSTYDLANLMKRSMPMRGPDYWRGKEWPDKALPNAPCPSSQKVTP